MAGGRYDNALRALVEGAPHELCALLLGTPIRPDAVRRLPGDLPANPIEADGVFELDDGSVLHVEFQLDARADDLHPRLVRYWSRLLDRSGRPPDQHVVVLRPPGLPGRYRARRLALHYTSHHLWDVPVERLLALDHLFPLASLGALPPGDDPLHPIEQVAQRIARIDDRGLRFDVATHAATLANIRVADTRTLEDVFRRLTSMPVDLRALPMVQEAMARGREEGREVGRDEGRVEVLRRQVVARFGLSASDRADRIPALGDAALDALTVDLLTLPDLAALDAWLAEHA